MAITKRVRFEVFKRDKFTCQYCGKRPPDVVLEVDHITPRVEGGSDDMHNLTTACFACNRGKAGVPLGEAAPGLDELEVLAGVQEMMERALTLRRASAVAEATKRAEDEAITLIREWWAEEIGDDSSIEDASLRRFMKELDMDDIRTAVHATGGQFQWKRYVSPYRKWQYFCGVCWKMIKGQRTDDE